MKILNFLNNKILKIVFVQSDLIFNFCQDCVIFTYATKMFFSFFDFRLFSPSFSFQSKDVFLFCLFCEIKFFVYFLFQYINLL
jgi:hypothetical protein